MAMIEALASGLPVIAARTGAIHEVVSEGVNGLLYEPGSDEELVAAVRCLHGDDAMRRSFGLRARAAAEERDWKASTATLRSYYEEALDLRFQAVVGRL